MTKTYRELMGKEKRQIKKLVVSKCANYDKEYGCLPLDCECPMFGICFTNSALCRKFRAALLPEAPYSSQCPLPSVKNAASTFRRTVNVSTVRTSAPLKQDASKRRQEYANTGRRNTMSNRFALEKPCTARLFGGHFCIGRVFIPVARF